MSPYIKETFDQFLQLTTIPKDYEIFRIEKFSLEYLSFEKSSTKWYTRQIQRKIREAKKELRLTNLLFLSRKGVDQG